MAIPNITSDTIIKLLVRRGLDTDRVKTTLANGELGYTTDEKRLFVGDGSTPGGKLAGNLGGVAAKGKENLATYSPQFIPRSGDLLFEQFDSNGNNSNILFIYGNQQWVNVHPVYSPAFSYNGIAGNTSTGGLGFNKQYFNLDTATGYFGIGTTVAPQAKLDVNGNVNVSGNLTVPTANLTQGYVTNSISQSTQITNKLYVDSKFLPQSGFYSLIQPWVHTNFVNVSGDTMTGNLDLGLNNFVILSAAPVNPKHSTNKQYVDDLVADAIGTSSAFGSSRFVPISGGAVVRGPLTFSPSINSPGGPAIYISQTNNQQVVFKIDDTKLNTKPLIVDNYGAVGIGDTPPYGGRTQLSVFGNASVTQLLTAANIVAGNSLGVNINTPLTKAHIGGALRVDSETVSPYTQSVNSQSLQDVNYRTNTYLVLPGDPAGAATDWCYLRQIGSGDYYTLSFDLFDNPNSNTSGQAFAIRNINETTSTTQVLTRFLIDGVGNIGINTNAPTQRLTINDGNILLNTNSTGLYFTDASNSHPYMVMQGDNNFVFYGTNSTGGQRPIWSVFQRSDSSTFRINTSASVSGSLSTTGNSVIGGNLTVSNGLAVNSGGLTVNGTINATGDITPFYTSDARLKDNIKPITCALEKIDSIQGVEFDWNHELSDHTGHDIGVLAQEIEEVLPEAVITRDNGYKAVRYEKLIPLLLQAVKELKAQLASK